MALSNGYPTAAGILAAAQIGSDYSTTTTGTNSLVKLAGGTDAATCSVSYTEAASGSAPTISVATGGC